MRVALAIAVAIAMLIGLPGCHADAEPQAPPPTSAHGTSAIPIDVTITNAPAASSAVVSRPLDAGAPVASTSDGDDSAKSTGASDFSVRFERTACLGTCPMYTVIVDAHGKVRFASRLYSSAKGIFVDGCAIGDIGDKGVLALKAAIAKHAYFTLKDQYLGGPTDAPWVDMRVTVDGKTKGVDHYQAAPVFGKERDRLFTFEDDVDRITGAADLANKVGTLTPCKYEPSKL